MTNTTGPYFARKGSFCVECFAVFAHRRGAPGRFDLHRVENCSRKTAERLYAEGVGYGWPVQILDHEGALVKRSCEVELVMRGEV